MINMRTHTDRVQVAFWDAVIDSLSKLRSLRTYRQEALAPNLTLRKTYAPRSFARATKFQVPVNARLFLLQLTIGSLFGFLIGFLFGLLH